MSVDMHRLRRVADIFDKGYSLTIEDGLISQAADCIESQAAEIDDIRKERDALRAALLAIDSLRGPFMSDDDIASVWKLVDTTLSGEQK